VFFGDGVDDLNLLSGVERVQVGPEGWVGLGRGEARQTKDSKQEQDLVHGIPRCLLNGDGKLTIVWLARFSSFLLVDRAGWALCVVMRRSVDLQ